MFENLKNEKGKYNYVVELAKKIFKAKNIGDLATKSYSKIYGEIEANEVAELREYDENKLKTFVSDTSGFVVVFEIEMRKLIDNLKSIGYNEEEVRLKVGKYADEFKGTGRNAGRQTDIYGRTTSKQKISSTSGTNKILREDYKRTSGHRKTDLIEYTREPEADSSEPASVFLSFSFDIPLLLCRKCSLFPVD